MSLITIFTNVVDDVTKKIPRTPKSPSDYLSSPNLDSFFISPCIAEEISSRMQSLKNCKSSGPNRIPVNLLKNFDRPISKDLSVLINESFLTRTYPAKLKIAKVIPIFEKNLPPVNQCIDQSQSSVLCKLVEKLKHQRLYQFLEVCEVSF